ncbi:hypothetical protein M9Y10_003382 [Tritrichomonas musculus]|uniref:receptor protein-tyrosine kinase n=1 Tax=Tritrichomonas musculus TaxID=1915356 RepID=A0ABR2JPJ7_9EUKA
MTQAKRSFEPIKPINRANKNFVYKGKKYPINFCLLKQYSNFFYNQRKHFKNTEDIKIQTSNFEITEEAIPMFVACCQNQSFDITDSTAFSLYHLSIQYEVPGLTKLSDEYIKQNYKNLVLQSISYIIKSRSSEVKFDLSKEENVISSHFFEYIDNDQLISLPVQVLYRILNNNSMNYQSLTPENQKRVVDFLFVCLDKHGREASVLFSNFDFGAARTDVLSRLMYDYSGVFDFGMINSHFLLNTTSQLLSEVERLKIEHSNKLLQMEKMVVEQAEVARRCEVQLEEAKKEAVEAVAKSCRTVEEHIQKFESVLSSQKVEHKREIDELNRRISAMEKKIDEQSRIIENQTNKHVVGIRINSKSNVLMLGKETKLTASLVTSGSSDEGVEWKVEQGEGESAVEVCEYNEKELVLRGITLGKKVKVVAVPRDGSSVEAMKEFMVVGWMSGKVMVSVQENQTIKGTIDLVEHGVTLDKQKSRYLLSSSADVLGVDGYSSGLPIRSLSQAVSFMKSKGEFYLHALVVDSNGNSFELVSGKLATEGVKLTFNYSGAVQTVELERGDYRLEVWGAQGGTGYYYPSERAGGKGGYSAGTISLQSRTKLFVYVGGRGEAQESSGKVEGGFNGGGYSADTQTGYKKGVGGGGTDIRVREDSLYARVIVAGGGGGGNGSGCPSGGGVGGGEVGGVGSKQKYEAANASAGTQTCGGKPGKGVLSENLTSSGESVATGAFGLGGSVTSEIENTRPGAGGGGWYGGGAGNGHGGSGAGGSGWVFATSSFSRWKSGNPSDAGRFLLGDEHHLADAVTVSGGSEFASPNGSGKETGHNGHGFARITGL